MSQIPARKSHYKDGHDAAPGLTQVRVEPGSQTSYQLRLQRPVCGPGEHLRCGSSRLRRALSVKQIPDFKDSVRSDRKQNISLIFICLQVRMIIYGNIRLNQTLLTLTSAVSFYTFNVAIRKF